MYPDREGPIIMSKNLLSIFIFVFVGAVIFFSIMIEKLFSEIFNNIAVGIGALLAGLGGGVAFWEWVKKNRELRKFKIIKDTYLREKIKREDSDLGTFKLFRFGENNGKIYIYDLDSKKKHWIKNWGTYIELGYRPAKDHVPVDWKEVTDENIPDEYKSYKEGDDIVVP